MTRRSIVRRSMIRSTVTGSAGRWRAGTGRALAGLAATTLLLGGCAFDPAAVPIPGTEVSGPAYEIGIEFSNALNLPMRAKIFANGVRIGTVEDVTVHESAEPGGHGGYVVVRASISESVRLPVTTTADLRQDTVLGDIHLALTTPPDGFGELLGAGGTIPLRQTRPPIQIEDTLAGMATFVQGGAINRMQEIVNRFNAVLPEDPAQTARIAQVVGGDAIDLAANLAQVESLLNGLGGTAASVRANGDELAELLTDDGVRQVSDSVTSIVGVVGVLGALGEVAHSLAWLAPLAQSGDAAAAAFVPLALTGRPLDLNAPSNLNALVALIRDKIIPWVEHGPKANIIAARITGAGETPGTDEQIEHMLDALRMIGAVR
ncbi:MlaD family protein [Nocardia sp. NPDC057668]|uniref:MlaD family protein n=1 Tax=Nocardia sp. NPDC057668 TaxID=3346202 RepID=UPI00366EF70A